MKKPSLLIFALVACAFAGCETTSGPSARIQEKATVFGTLTPYQQANVQKGVIEVGDTPDMVYIALGQPSKRTTPDAADNELWTYEKYFPTAASQLTLNNPNTRHTSGQVSSSAPRDGASLNSTARSGPEASLAIPDMESDTLFVSFAGGKVSSIQLASQRR